VARGAPFVTDVSPTYTPLAMRFHLPIWPSDATADERRRLGRTDMVRDALLGFGGSEIGYERASARTVAGCSAAARCGLNVVDTAECYDDSEALIGTAWSPGETRSTCSPSAATARLRPRDWREASLLSSIERSLKRLRTDRLDLIQLHSCELSDLKKGEPSPRSSARGAGFAVTSATAATGGARYAIECGRSTPCRPR